MEITLSNIQIIDLFLRFSAVGQLGLLIAFLLRTSRAVPFSQIILIGSLISYILLTAPIDDRHYGYLRNILLLITDLIPLASLWFILTTLNKDFKLMLQPKWLLIPLFSWLTALVYVFLVLNGRHILHDINHGIGMAILLGGVYLCLAEYVDDLDNRRRNTRLLMVAFCCFYMIGLVSFEFVNQAMRDTWLFSVANACIIFVLVSVISARLISVTSANNHPLPTKLSKNDCSAKSTPENEKKESKQLAALNKLMNEGAFLQQELNVAKLAEMINIPPHQLRQLINQQLGFSNFSHYLNSYRIPWVCEQLKDISKKHLPILTIALEAGYGSIAPFNRAFKAQLGQTPKEYRGQF